MSTTQGLTEALIACRSVTPDAGDCAALLAAIAAQCGVQAEMSTTGGTSDGRFIARICPQVIEFGVVNDSIHKVDEWVDVAAIDTLKNVYRRTLENFLR